jgi:hypothetical protein
MGHRNSLAASAASIALMKAMPAMPRRHTTSYGNRQLSIPAPSQFILSHKNLNAAPHRTTLDKYGTAAYIFCGGAPGASRVLDRMYADRFSHMFKHRERPQASLDEYVRLNVLS